MRYAAGTKDVLDRFFHNKPLKKDDIIVEVSYSFPCFFSLSSCLHFVTLNTSVFLVALHASRLMGSLHACMVARDVGYILVSGVNVQRCKPPWKMKRSETLRACPDMIWLMPVG